MPDYSVVIPLYNKGPHIERAIRSVQAQTVPPVEIIVVDDGSVDGGFEWVQALALPNLVLDRRAVAGPGGYAARNRGIELAKSEWIAFLDADDEWQADHLERVTRALEASHEPSGVVSVFSGYEDVYADGRHHRDPYSQKVGGGITEMDFAALLGHWVSLNASPMWTSATVCRRSALLDAGRFPEARCRRGGDKDTWLRVAHMGTTIYTGAVTARYFRDSVNMTTRKSYSNVVPCIVHSTKQLAALETGTTAMQIRTLQNLEIYNYALVSARTGGLEKTSWADFDADLDPSGRRVLSFLSTPIGAVAARLAFALKRLVRR
jgi:glycosyltransferase involved in cell wall biosynthesis